MGLTLERSVLRIWMPVAEIMDVLIRRLDVLQAHDTSADFRRNVDRLDQELCVGTHNHPGLLLTATRRFLRDVTE